MGLLPPGQSAQRLLQQVRPWIEPAQSYEKNQLGLSQVFFNSLRLTWCLALRADAAVLLRAHPLLHAPLSQRPLLSELAPQQGFLDCALVPVWSVEVLAGVQAVLQIGHVSPDHNSSGRRPPDLRRRKAGQLMVQLLIFTLGVSAAAGVPWQIDNWNVEKGLPHNTVTAIGQTREGFLWAATVDGLARFDGRAFRVFSARNTPTLGSGRVRWLCGDDSGRLWLGTSEEGVYCYSGGQFTRISLGSVFGAARLGAMTTAGDTVWLASESGILAKLEDGGVRALRTNSIATGRSLRLTSYGSGAVYAVNGQLVEQVWPAEPRLVRSSRDRLSFAVPGRNGWWLGAESSLQFWQGNRRINLTAFPAELMPLANAATEDREGGLWIGTEGHGLWRCGQDGSIEVFSTTNGLGGDVVHSVFVDQEGAVWAGSEGGGLSCLRHKAFQGLPRSAGLPPEPVTTVCEGAAGELWIGTERSGLYRLAKGQAERIGTAKRQPLLRVGALAFDSTDRLWVGTRESGLFFVQDGVAQPFRGVYGLREVAMVFEDDRSELWVDAGASNAMLRIIGDAPQPFPVPGGAGGLELRAMAGDSGGGLWFGTAGNGLWHWDGRDYRHYGRADGLSSETILSLLPDNADGALWIGTAGGGLSRYREGRVQTCTSENGLFDNVVCQVLDDGRGWLWCGSPHGVFRVTKQGLVKFFEGQSQRLQCMAYGLGDGLVSLECAGGTQPAGCRSHDGRLWWPTAKGLVWVDPKEVPTNGVPPVVVIDELVAGERHVDFGGGRVSKSGESRESQPGFVLEAGTKQLAFRFTALSWQAPEFVTFRYQLEGFDRGWVEAGNERVARYGHVGPGTYQFRVTAANREGVWNEAGAVVGFRVLPHFYQTWWFAAGVVVLSLGLIVAVVRTVALSKLKRRLRQLEAREAVEKERSRIARDIHDELGASLTQIMLMSELPEEELKSPEVVRPQLRRISSKARSVVQALNDIVWAINPSNDNLPKLIDYLCAVSEEMCEAAGVRCFHEVPVGLPARPVPVGFRHNLFLAVKEALNNALKHARAREIWLRVEFDDHGLRISVEDNGRGFETRSGRLFGNGLKNMQVRAETLGGRVELSSQPGKGTQVKLSVPLPPAE